MYSLVDFANQQLPQKQLSRVTFIGKTTLCRCVLEDTEFKKDNIKEC